MDRGQIDLKEIFRQAREDLLFPPISRIEIGGTETAEVDLVGSARVVKVGAEFIQGKSEKAIKGALHHELNHWVKHPYDAKTVIQEIHWLMRRTDLGRNGLNFIRQQFDDIIDNLDLVLNKGLEEISQLYREAYLRGKADKLLRSYYSDVTGLSFGVSELEEDLRERKEALKKINFLDTTKLEYNLERFTAIVEALVREEGGESPLHIYSIRDFSPEEIEKGLEEIAKEVNAREFKEISEEIRQELEDWFKESDISDGTQGIGLVLKGLEEPDIHWYLNRARRYQIRIEPYLSADGGSYPKEIRDFELGDPIEFWVPEESYGKIIPSLAKGFERGGFETYHERNIPNAVIFMDSSGSMPKPSEGSYPVIGAFAVAKTYLDNGSKVGVVNFSEENISIKPTANREGVYKSLIRYQGGGTTLHISPLKEYCEDLDENVEYIMISDAGLYNLAEVIDFLSEQERRTTVIWMGKERELLSYKGKYEQLKSELPCSVTFCEIEREDEIPRIVVGKAFGWYLWQRSQTS